jgi:hypothetical protein
MVGVKSKKGGYGLRYNADWQIDKEDAARETLAGQDGGPGEGDTLDLIRLAVSKVITTGMAAFRAELKKDLSDFHASFREDIKKQMEEFSTEIDRKMQDTAGQIEGAVKRIDEMEETWPIWKDGTLG